MRRSHGTHRRHTTSPYERRSLGPRILLVALVVVVVLVAAAGAFVGVQLNRATPAAAVTVVLDRNLGIPGVPPHLPVPAGGATVVTVQGVGTVASVRPDVALPLASITKLVTALVVLRHHPLSLGQSGPALSVPASLAAAYPSQLAAHDSLIPLHAGEHLSELQALEALLIPSADNVAQLLATWTSGTMPAFVAAMNAEAARLGLHQTHLADASGLSAGSVGSAADLIRLARVVMAQPLLRAIVAMPQVTLPLAGTVYNYDYDLGHDGIVGIKTGSTIAAGGDFLFAARRSVHGRRVLVMGAVLGQQGRQPLPQVLAVAERLAVAAPAGLEKVTVLPAGRTVLRFRTAWGASATAVTTRAVQAWVRPGDHLAATVHLDGPASAPLRSLRAGQQVASVSVVTPTGTVTVPVTAVQGFRGPALRWRLERG
ncbi:MAG: hypothetical protein M0Z42_12480 [Actinomycetota bacterium]|nr:hypothetical protein [Actinomycetota bacterium]